MCQSCLQISTFFFKWAFTIFHCLCLFFLLEKLKKGAPTSSHLWDHASHKKSENRITLLLADTDVHARGYVLLGQFRLPTPLSTFSNGGALGCDFIAGRRALALCSNSTWKKSRLWATGDELLRRIAVKQQLIAFIAIVFFVVECVQTSGVPDDIICKGNRVKTSAVDVRETSAVFG